MVLTLRNLVGACAVAASLAAGSVAGRSAGGHRSHPQLIEVEAIIPWTLFDFAATTTSLGITSVRFLLLAAAFSYAALAAGYMVLAVIPQTFSDGATRRNLAQALTDTIHFYTALAYYIIRGGTYPSPYFGDNLQAQCQVYSLALVYKMWSQPHYRNGDFHEDMVKNLRNVAIPGTGIPLCVICYFKAVAVVFLLLGYPLAAVVSALHLSGRNVSKTSVNYSRQLLNPQDWFSFWQLNCRLATHHSGMTPKAKGYGMEDKLAFLQKAAEENIAVTPYMTMPKLIVKHRNEEGGLGFHAFSNCVSGGDWIIQEALENDTFVASLLPDDAPLSTFRVISASRGGMHLDNEKQQTEEETIAGVTPLSCVFRAGREGAATDHVSVLFDVDMKTGVIGRGTTNMNWYQLGLSALWRTPWTNEMSTTVHPDTGKQISDSIVPDMKGMLKFVKRAHARMMPDVPLAGWDVAFTNKGMLLLEANLSCNFFRGSFDKRKYFEFVNDYFVFLAKTADKTAAH